LAVGFAAAAEVSGLSAKVEVCVSGHITRRTGPLNIGCSGFMRWSQTMSNPTKLTCVAVAFLAIAIAGAQFWEGRAVQQFCFADDASSCAADGNFDFTAFTVIR
jgi:hypothetical protein